MAKIALTIVGFLTFCTVLSRCQQTCDSEHPCPNFCPDEYHEQCVRKECICPNRSCERKSDCPSGNMSGCPPGQETCVEGHCRCERNRT